MQSFDQLYIGGRWVDPATDERLEVRSPATGELVDLPRRRVRPMPTAPSPPPGAPSMKDHGRS